MLRLALAALCAPLLFVAPAQAGATFPTLSQARAAHPAAHLSYRTLESGRCWYVGRKPSKDACQSAMRKADPPARARGMAILCGGKCNRNYGAIEWTPRAPVPHVTLTARYWP